MSSTQATLNAGHLIDKGPVSILAGGQSLQVSASTLLTPAERLAVYQVVSSGSQSIQLGAAGNAVGGSLAIGPRFGQFIQSLTIPQNVTVLDNVAVAGALNLAGSLTNGGKIFFFSTTPAVQTASLSAASINNLSGALVTTVLPVNLLPSSLNAISGLNLNLSAAGNITNSGTISSAGNLNVFAGRGVTNALPAGVSSIAPVMHAVNNVAISSAIGNIVNQGIIGSQLGNINFSAPALQNLNLTNAGGLISAPQGSINFRDAAFTGANNLSVLGGNLQSQAVNAYSGNGVVQISVNEIVGKTNVYAGEAHIAAATNNLVLGDMVLSGDPTFYNQAGDITIAGDMVLPGQPLAIVASGNITSVPGAGRIDTSTAAGNGGAITLIAGANFTSTGQCCALTSGAGDTTSTLTVVGGSATGGNIDLASTPITSLTSASTAGNGNGGNLTAVAYSGLLPNTGNIKLPGALTVTSGGSGTGTNGDVTMIAQAANGTTISQGSIDTRGGATGGNINILTANPVLANTGSCPNCLTIKNGSILTGGYDISATPLASASAVGDSVYASNGGRINLKGNFYYNNVIADGLGSQTAGSVNIQTTSGLFTIGGGVVANGIGNRLSANGGPLGGDGGSIKMLAPVAAGSTLFLANPAKISASASNGNGGSIAISLGDNESFSFGSGTISADAGTQGKGGNVALSSSSFFCCPTATGIGAGPMILSANGAGTGNGGATGVAFTYMNGINIGNGPGQISLSATGGSPGSAAGNGGSIQIYVPFSAVPSIDMSAVKLQPLGVNGNGGSIYISSSNNLPITGNINLDGVGTGNGGNLTLFLFNNFSSTFNIGAGPTANGVNGNLSSNAGAAPGASAGSIFVFSQQDVAIGSLSALSVNTNGNGGSIQIITNGSLTLPTGTISVNGSAAGNYNGGSIMLTVAAVLGNNVNITGGGPLVLSANGSGTGNGGALNVVSANLSIGAGAGQMSFSATGGSAGSAAGDGGSISIFTNNSLVVNTALLPVAPLGNNGNGGQYTFQAGSVFVGSNLRIAGTLDVSGVGTGRGGNLSLTSGASFTLGDSSVSGVDGVKLTGGATGGGAGYLRISSAVSVTVTSWATADFTATSGNGGSIDLSSRNSLGNLQPINLPAGTVNLNAVGAGAFAGGYFSVNGLVTTAGALQINANGSGTGAGGSISVSQLVGGPTPSASATGGSAGSAAGDGGFVSITGNMANLAVNGGSIVVNPIGVNGRGGQVTLGNVGGNLAITGSLDAQSAGTGLGGVIIISSSSGLPFNIGGGTANGITGSFLAGGVANGGSVSLTNSNGIVLTAPANIDVSPVSGNGGSITLNAGSSTLILPSGTLSTSAVGPGDFNGGALSLTAGSITNSGSGNLLLSADASGLGAINNISITAANSPLVIGTGIGEISLSAAGVVGIPSAFTPSVSISAGNNLTVNGSAIQLGTTAGGSVVNLSLTAGQVLNVTGNVYTPGNGYGDLTLTYKDAVSPFIVGGAVPNSGATGAITAGGNLNIINTAGAANRVQVSSTISAGNGGSTAFHAININGVTSANLSGAGTVTGALFMSAAAVRVDLNTSALTVGSLSSSGAGALQVVAPSISMPFFSTIRSSGDVTIGTASLALNGTITSSAAGATLKISNAGSLGITGGGIISATAAGANAITISTANPGANLQIAGSFGYSPGAGNTTTLQSSNGTVQFSSCTLQTIASGLLVVAAPVVTFGDKTTINSLAAAGNAVSFTSGGGANPLAVSIADASVATVQTAGGSISFAPTSGQSLSFAKVAGPGLSTLNLHGGTTSFTASGMTAGARLTIDMDNSATITGAAGSLTFSNSGTIQNTSGVTNDITISNAGGAMSLTNPGSVLAGRSLLITNTGGAVTGSNAGTLQATNGQFQLSNDNSTTLTSDGSISGGPTTFSAQGNLSITGGAGSSVTGTGGISATSIAGAVNLTQDILSGTLTGSAGGGSFTGIANVSALTTAGAITAAGGDLTLKSNANTITVGAGSTLTGRNNVIIAGSTGANIGLNSTVTAGTVSGALNPLSTNFADYDMSGFNNVGAVSLTSAVGNVALGNNVQLFSRGGDVSLKAGAQITTTGATTIFAQGGNALMNAGTSVTIPGGNITAIARAIPLAPPIIINGQSVPDFQGGGIAIYSGTPGANLTNILRTDSLARVGAGYFNVGPGVATAGNTYTYVPNAGYISMQIQGAGTLSATGSTYNANGGVIAIDPPTNITITGVTFVAVEPSLVPLPPPPPPPATLGSPSPASGIPTLFLPLAALPVVTAPSTFTSTSASSATSTVLATESTKLGLATTTPATIAPSNCVPAAMAEYSENGESWSVAAGSCQSFSFASKDGATITGTGGTAVSQTGNNEVNLKKGHLMAMAGPSGMSVRTTNATIQMPAESSAIIDETADGTLRIDYMDGAAATMEVTSKGQTLNVVAEQGQEIVIAKSSASDEELIPTDGVERITVEAKISFADLGIRKNSFSRKSLAEKDQLMSCVRGCIPTRVKDRIYKLKAAIDSPNRKISTAAAETSFSVSATSANRTAQYKMTAAGLFRPVANVTPVTTAPSGGMNIFDNQVASIRYIKTSNVSFTNDSTIDLIQGEVVISAARNAVVTMPGARVDLAAGSVAVLKRRGNVVSVSTVFSNNAGAVRFTGGKRTIAIPVGNELLVAESGAELDKVIKADTTGRRGVRILDLPYGGSAMTSEVSFVSTMFNSPILQQIFQSKNDDDRSICDKISKMAVCLSVVTGKHGPFAPIQNK